MSKILIVEDELNISKLIEDTLALGSYETEVSSDGIDALNKINNNCYDLILLDIMLPKLDGFEILEKLENNNTPIIFLSAKSDVNTIVRGLKTGVDYMTKPFEPLELLARVELRIKKTKRVYNYRNIKLDNTKREVYLENKIVNLSPKEYALFFELLSHIDEVLSREELLNKVWGILSLIHI